MLEDLHPIWIDTPDRVEDVASTVTKAKQMVLDTEADSLHSYFHKVCLLQVTADGQNFVIDPLALERTALQPLWALVEDPDLPVLMHGSDYDIRVLDRDYQTRVRGLIDTQIMAQVLGEPKTGLAALLGKELDVTLDKKHQRADWGHRPLTPSQLTYAAADTAFLEALAKRLRARLEDLDRWDWAVEEFARLETVRHRAPEPNPLAFERVKGARALRGEARDRAFTLFDWREAEAQRLDIPPFKVLGNKTLVAMAEAPPENKGELAEVNGIGPRFARRWGDSVLRSIRQPKQAPQWKKAPRHPDPGPRVVRRLKRIAAVRDVVAADLAIEPGLLCAKNCMLAVASRQPRCATITDLGAAGLQGWRLDLLGEKFIEALADET